jgi:hypothetical protein
MNNTNISNNRFNFSVIDMAAIPGQQIIQFMNYRQGNMDSVTNGFWGLSPFG